MQLLIGILQDSFFWGGIINIMCSGFYWEFNFLYLEGEGTFKYEVNVGGLLKIKVKLTDGVWG